MHIRRHRIVARILRWYDRDGRTFPWRGISDQYRILLSEIMLQQTQAGRVLQLYPVFLRRFPTLASLARAPLGDVIVVWRGMGYNNRAVRLHCMARVLAGQHGMQLPATAEALTALPGIGKYTAHALLSSVHGHRVPIVDINVRRFFSRLFFRMKTLDALRPEAEIWAVAAEQLPRSRSYDWNQALMDIGSTLCTKRNPLCDRCPVSLLCASRLVMKRVTAARRKWEPSRGGLPNRIYRGRIVEQLRTASRAKGMTVAAVGRRIRPGYAPSDRSWLDGLLRRLADDGLVIVRNTDRLVARVFLA